MEELSRDEFYQVIMDGLARYARSAFMADVLETVKRHPEPMLAHALNKNQIRSKTWLIDEVRQVAGPRLGTVYVLGGWYGVLAAMLLDDRRLAVDRVLSIDIDPGCVAVAETLNRRHLAAGRFAAVTADMMAMDYGRARFRAAAAGNEDSEIEAAPDVIANTACEHLDPFAAWYDRIPAGTLLALQSNDMFGEPVHTNCVRDLQEFRAQAPMAKTLFAGELAFRRYTRFMLIGRK